MNGLKNDWGFCFSSNKYRVRYIVGISSSDKSSRMFSKCLSKKCKSSEFIIKDFGINIIASFSFIFDIDLQPILWNGP